MANGISGLMNWDGFSRANVLTPVALCAFDQGTNSYRPLNTLDISGAAGGGGSITISNVIVSGSAGNTSSNASPASGDGTLANANSLRVKYNIQNLSTGVKYVKEGAGASPTSFNYILSAGASEDDGRGGFMTDNIWKGIISVAGQPGISGRYIFSETT